MGWLTGVSILDLGPMLPAAVSARDELTRCASAINGLPYEPKEIARLGYGAVFLLGRRVLVS